jgi:transposase
VKSAEEIMEILEGFDLTASYRDAAELAGCSPNTVAHWVAHRDAGTLVPGQAARRPSVIDEFLPKLEELVERSKGKIRADVAHDKITAMGFAGSERTTRRAVAEIKKAWQVGRRRVHRPWVPEPGMWAQYDFGDGPRIGGTATILFCFWLAWCRFRVVVPLLDKSGPSVFAAIDTALRAVGGVPTYLLTDNERTVTVEHVAGIAVRNPATVAFGRHYGLTIATCVPADPASKGGSEASVRVAKADLVPTAANLLPAYASFAELEAACAAFTVEINARPHRVTRRAPVEMLAEERVRLHPLPAAPFTATFGVTRTVGTDTPMVCFDTAQYSVPHRLAGETVWVRRHGEQVVIVHVAAGGPVEVARHQQTMPGSPRVAEAHFPPAPAGALARTPRPRTSSEAAFLALGDGARLWLTEAAAAGAARVRAKTVEAVELARLHSDAVVDRALGQAATSGRFAEGDLAAILSHQATALPGPAGQAGEGHTLAQGTAGWAGFGEPDPGQTGSGQTGVTR